MIALLPIPVTTNRPLDWYIFSTAATKLASSKSANFEMDRLSESIVFLALAKIFDVVVKTE